MRAIILALLLCATVLAGCAEETSAPDDDATPDGGAQFVDDEKGVQVDLVTLSRDPPAPGERNLTHPPEWRLGEWWQYRITDVFTGETRDVHRVVAGTEHGNYLVGFPADAFSNDVLVLHVPGYGDILRDDISYAAHDVPYTPLQWPLEEGASWTTHFESEGNELTFVVESVDEAAGTAQLTAGGGQGSGTFVYDANVGEIVEWNSPGYAQYEVIDHGYNWEGLVRVPHDHDLIFFHGRLAGVFDAGAGIPGSPGAVNPVLPDESVEVDGTYDRLSFAIILLDLPGQTTGVSSGAYQLTATAPDGETYTDMLTPADMSGIKTTFFGAEDPQGTWDIQAIAGGAGIAFLEGIGYHSIDIDLPSGCVQESARADHHVLLEECE